ncbi:MAG: hypothetical protein KC619_28420 [Myxococcales bacterium]|nr:hypothetical protein [Myxococcales bacterium]
MGARVLVALTSRVPLSPQRVASPAFQRIHATLELKNLRPESADAYLALHQIPRDEREAIIHLTAGHPLALNLVVSQYAMTPSYHLEADPRRGLLAALVETLAGGDPVLEGALDTLAVPRSTDLTTLERVLGVEAAAGAFRWLAGLPFVEASERGLVPHAELRDLLHAALLRERPERLDQITERVIEVALERLGEGDVALQRERFLEACYACRHTPVLRDSFGDVDLEGTSLDAAREADVRACAAMAERHLGAQQGEWARRWGAHPEAVHYVIRDAHPDVAAFTIVLPLRTIDDDALLADPLGPGLLDALRAHGVRRDDVHWFRFWLSRDGSQPSRSMLSLMPSGAAISFGHADLGRFFALTSAEPDSWEPVLPLFPMWRGPNVELEAVGYAHFFGDLQRHEGQDGTRVRVGDAYGAVLERILRPQRHEPPMSAERFEQALREALKDLHRSSAHDDSPLLALLPDASGPRGLATLLIARIDEMLANPRYRESGEVLRLTYVEPEVKQLAVAEQLQIPFGTYRYRLRKAHRQLGEVLLARVPHPKRPLAPLDGG